MSPRIVVSLWTSRAHGRHVERTWPEFIEHYVASPEPAYAKDRVAGFSLGLFKNDHRNLPNVERVYALGLDLDEGDCTLRQATRLFPGVRAVVYTTFSFTPEHPKLRLFLLLSRAVTSAEYERIWLWASTRCAKHGRIIDPSTKDPSRFWYLPSYPLRGPNHYAWKELPGRRLNVERALRAAHALRRPLSDQGRPSKSAARVGQKRGGARGPASESFFGRAFELAGKTLTSLERKPPKNGSLPVECPWSSDHTTGVDGDTSTAVLPPTSDSRWGLFKCLHGHCAERTSNDLLDVLDVAALDGARNEHGRGLVRVRLVHGWVQHLPAKPGYPALDRMWFWCEPTRGGQRFQLQVVLGSEMHHYLGDLSLSKLEGRRADVALERERGAWKPTSARLVPEERPQRLRGAR